MHRPCLAIACLVLLAACGPGSAGSAGPSPATASPGTGASRGPSESPGSASPHASQSFPPLASGPRITVSILGEAPVIVRTDGPPGHTAVLPGATGVDADGSVVAFLVWFGDARGDHVVTLARSPDGRHWAIDPDPVYTDLGLGLAHPGPIPADAIREADGTWALYGWGADPVRQSSFFTWHATAPAAEGPWTVPIGQGAVLEPGPGGAWDDDVAAVASVVADEHGYAMWYEGQQPGRTIRGGIGYATSADGIGWTRFDDPATAAEGDPVLAPGQCGPGTSLAVVEPQVWRRDDGYLMVFSGYDDPQTRGSVFGATSPDGRTWSCTGERLLESDVIPGSEGIHTIRGLTIAGEPYLFVESLRDGGSEIWLASVSVGP